MIGEAAETEDLLAQVGTACTDLVLLDWELPDRGGAAILAGLRAARPGPVVIALSGRPEARRAALAAGADAFVSKRDPPERLLAAVDDCWHRRHGCATGCQPVVSLTSARFRARGSKL